MKPKILIALAALFASVALAQTATFGDWFIVNADDGSGDVIAATGTEGGSELLGYRCFVSSNSCTYVLVSDTQCEELGKYPLLVNASSGANLVTGICSKAGRGELAITPYKAVEASIKEASGLLGFAIPMKSGAFKAIRFSLRGGDRAIQEAERLLAVRRSRTAPTGTPGRATSTTF